MALVQAQEWDKSTSSCASCWLPRIVSFVLCRVTWLKILLGDVILWKIVTSDVKVE